MLELRKLKKIRKRKKEKDFLRENLKRGVDLSFRILEEN